MAATGNPSHSQHDGQQHLHNQDPNSTQSQQAEQLPPQQPPLSETLDFQNSPQSPGAQNSQQSDKHEDNLLILDGDSQQKDKHQSGTPHTTLPEPIVLTDDAENTSPPPEPPVMSPTNLQRRVNKRKKAGYRKTYKRKRPTKKIQNLTDILNPIPFVPTTILDLDKHAEVLERLGLYEFSKIELDSSFRTDLIVQLIVNYDSKKRCSYVNDLRISVNRADLARALKLPAAKQDKGSSSVVEVDLDSEVFSDEAIEFIEDFVFNWILLHDESSVMTAEIANWTRCIRDGHPEKLDPASLIWYKVEKELTQGDKLVDCYYAPHLQYLIRSQRPAFFMEDDDGVADDGEENVKADEEKEENEEQEEKDEQEARDEKEEKYDEEEEEVEEGKVSIVQEQNIELSLGADVEEIANEEVEKDDIPMVDAEECNEEMEEQGNFKKVLRDHFLQRCQVSDMDNFEEIKFEEEEEVEEEHTEQVEDDEEEAEAEEGGERMDEGFDMEANDDSFDRDGLTDNFLQGVETSHNPYNSHGMDLFGSRDGTFMSHGGPSFYNNSGKRVMDPEEDIHHLDQNSKRLKTDEIWDQKQNDISFCFEQMQQLMQNAKMIHESKVQNYENLQYSQQREVEQLQKKQEIMEMMLKIKDEDFEKKHAEVLRLERELYLMGDLLAGYRKALNDTRYKFSEYRKRFPLREEPLYKDAGPGGLVLSTREIEKQRLKQEEDMMKFQILAKNFEDECVCRLELQNDRLLPMVDKLVSIENEVQRLKEIATQCKETQEPSAELEVSVEPEENQKLHDENELSIGPEENQKCQDEIPENNATMGSVLPDADGLENQKSKVEIPENDASMETVPCDADESEKKGDGQEH